MNYFDTVGFQRDFAEWKKIQTEQNTQLRRIADALEGKRPLIVLNLPANIGHGDRHPAELRDVLAAYRAAFEEE